MRYGTVRHTSSGLSPLNDNGIVAPPLPQLGPWQGIRGCLHEKIFEYDAMHGALWLTKVFVYANIKHATLNRGTTFLQAQMALAC